MSVKPGPQAMPKYLWPALLNCGKLGDIIDNLWMKKYPN
jgi:hypothetical protein